MVVFKSRFKKELKAIFDYISLDSESRAYDFINALFDKFQLIEQSPYAFRKSLSFNDENIRDFIYKGYVIPYLIDNDIVLILGIYKENI
ncbi:MAG: plasmid stabilization protein [Proteobacteria bacterium]|nr:MAG: plasmid stabilization protein [Pseudomonadota bacterium]